MAALAGFFVTVVGDAHGQAATVTAQVAVVQKVRNRQRDPQVVLWLDPLDATPPYTFPDAGKPVRLAQKNKTFEPHLLVVRAGSLVQFPNFDPFFHNVFSLFDGQRFDLGLYEAGTTRTVRFDRPGISYIFCNIHSQMSAVVVALDTPYYAVSGGNGSVVIPAVPPGRYMLHVWHEGTSPKSLAALGRPVVIGADNTSLGAVRVVEDELPVAHKNKYGRDYDDPVPASSGYPHLP